VGRGTFVAAPGPEAAFRLRGYAVGLNLAQNVRPLLSGQAALADALGKLRKTDLGPLMVYGPAAGHEPHRRAMAAWLQRTTPLKPDWRNLAITAGGQQAVALALGAVAAPHDIVLTEAGTYYGLRTLAEQAGYRLKGLALDHEGLDPEALDRAAAATGARVLYVTPPGGPWARPGARRSCASAARAT
jgi:DNA-binding transcriptional MocR family regulator